jgi:exosortase
MANRWSEEPQFRHGYLVPFFAAVLLWLRRGLLKRGSYKPSWGGIPLLMVGGCLQFFGAFFHYELIAALGLIPSLAGICALLMGWQGLRWAWPAIAFLLFMIPPPYFIQTALGMKL